jgi:hypothetical protein
MATGSIGNTTSSVSNLLKRYYKEDGLTIATFKKRPYWTMVTKKADAEMAVGSTFQWAININTPQSRNVLFPGAQSQGQGLSSYNTNALTGTIAGPPNVSPVGVVQFSVSRVMNFAYANISTELILASNSKAGAFDNAVTLLTDSALDLLANDQEISMFGGNIQSTNAGATVNTAQCGFISQVGTSTVVGSSAGALYLQYPADASKFAYGQELDLYYNNAGTITKRTLAGSSGLFVGSIDRTNGILYIVNSAGSAVSVTSVFSNAAVGDFICVSNDFNAGAATGTSGTSKIYGFESWVPFGGPVSDSPSNLFAGVNRNSLDITRLAGNWLDATGAIGPNTGITINIEDALITSSIIVSTQSDKEVDTFAMHPNQYMKLLKANQSRVVLNRGVIDTDIPGVSFHGMDVAAGPSMAKVVPDKWCGANRIYGLHMPSWFFIHLGDPVEQFDLDGNKGLREANLDAVAFRFFSLGNIVCSEPSANCTVNIAP